MEKAVVFLLSALFFSSLLSFALSEDRFLVEGKVYCDTCRTKFITRVSQYMKGAKVRLECKQCEGGSLTYMNEVETDESGAYRIPVDGDREEEICELSLVKSSDPNCDEMSNEPFIKQSARISLTGNNGLASPVREANPLGFLRKEALPECAEVLQELGFTKFGLV